MKYLIPSMSQFVIAMTYKYPEFIQQFQQQLSEIIKHLLSNDMRMEQVALSIASAIFEKIGIINEQFLKQFLVGMLTCLHFYRNNTKAKVIPVPIIKSVWSLIANFMIYNGSESILQACNSIQENVLFMIMISEGDKIKHITSPSRDKKYAIVAFSKFMIDCIQATP